MLKEIKEFFTPKPTVSELEEYILSKNPQTCEDVEYWTKMYDLRPKFVLSHLMPATGMINGL
jgi:hypothetical protein